MSGFGIGFGRTRHRATSGAGGSGSDLALAYTVGALTRNQFGAGIPTGASAIVSGDAGGHWLISGGRLYPSAAGDTADLNAGPYALVLDNGAQLTLTIEPDTWDVTDQGEWDQVASQSAAVLAGKSIALRHTGTLNLGIDGEPGTPFYRADLRDSGGQPLVIKGRKGVAGEFADYCQIHGAATLRGTLGITFRHLKTEPVAEQKFSLVGESAHHIGDIAFEDCWITGQPANPTGDYTNSAAYPNLGVALIDTSQSPVGTVGNISITNCKIEWADTGVDVKVDEPGAQLIVRSNEFAHFYSGAVAVSGGAGNWRPATIVGNYLHDPLGLSTDSAAPDTAAIRFTGTANAVADWEDIFIRDNVVLQGTARGEFAAICLEGMKTQSGDSGHFFTAIIRNNIVAISRSEKGIAVLQAKNCLIENNTVISWDRGSTLAPSIVIGASAVLGTGAGINVAQANIADALSAVVMQSANRLAGLNGVLIDYAALFDGPGFAPASVDDAYGLLKPKVAAGATAIGASPSPLTPGSNWTGEAGSGFDAIPSDPARTTAKPALRLITPPHQWFSDEIIIGAGAAANNNGSLFDNLGLEKVIVHYEGNSHEIGAPSLAAFDDVNGERRVYWGWWTKLANDGRHGNARVYFEAVPKDSSMQRRIIGPYQFSPKAVQYTHKIEIAATPSEIAGSRYKTLANAMGYLRTQPGPINPLLTITEAIPTGEFAGHPFGYNLTNHKDGYIHLTATVPVTFTQTSGKVNFDPPANGVRIFGRNITFDFKTATEFNLSSGWQGNGTWLDGINLTNSNGANDLKDKRGRNIVSQLVRGLSDPVRPFFTECNITALWQPCIGARLARGCTISDCWADIFNGTHAVIGNRVESWNFKNYRDLIDAMQVSYTGQEATATIAISGNGGSDNRIVTAKWGANSATFTIRNAIVGAQYNISDLVNWFNSTLAAADPGWNAVLLDDTRHAAAIANGADPASPLPPTNVKGAGTILRTAFDIHGDWYQIQNNGGVAQENNYIEGNITWDCQGQILLFNGEATRDVVILNNAWHMRDDIHSSNQFSQFQRSESHVVLAHNTIVNQGMWLRRDSGVIYDADTYCLIGNNVVRSIDWLGSGFDGDVTIANNRIFTGSQAPAGSTGTAIGGDSLTLFEDAGNGNFAPAGDLLSDLRPSSVALSLGYRQRAGTEAAGAVKG